MIHLPHSTTITDLDHPNDPRRLRKLRVTLDGFLLDTPAEVPAEGIALQLVDGETLVGSWDLTDGDSVVVLAPQPLVGPGGTLTVETSVACVIYARWAPPEDE